MSGAKQHALPPRSHKASAIGESEDLALDADRGNSFTQQAMGAQAPQGAAGGLFGWAKKAGGWMADNFDKAATAVGDFVGRTGQAAKDLYDIWSSSDVSINDGKIGLSTDMDEVMDMMPESAREMLQLDRSAGAENKVQLELDTRTKALTIRAPDLRIAGVQHDKIRSGAASLQGVVITITNPGGGLPGLDGAFSLLGYQDKDDNLGVDIAVARVLAQDVELPDGSLKARELELGAFRANASSRGGMPFGEKGATVASFSVGNAILRGLEAPGTQAEEVSGAELAGGLDQGAETAFAEAGELRARRLNSGGRALGSGSLKDVRADVRNTGGGMPFLDQHTDHMQSTVTAGEAKVLDASDSAIGRLGAGEARGIRATHDADAGAVGLNVDALSASGLDTQHADAASISATGLTADVTKQGENVSGNAAVGGLTVASLDTSTLDAEHVSATQLRARHGEGATTASVGSVDAAGLVGEGLRVKQARATDGQVSVGADSLAARVGSAQVHDARLDTERVDASLGSATVQGASYQQQGARSAAAAEKLSATGLAFQVDPATGKAPIADTTPSEFDAAKLTRTLSARVDDADVSARVPLRAGEYETGVGMEVERDTRLDASLRVRDNRIQSQGTSARFSNPIDGPAWTTLNGAYVDKDGRLKADVGGWADQDVGKSVNEGLGIPGKNLASVGTYGDAVADKMEAPPASTAGKKDGKPGLQDAFQLDQLEANARVSLSAGTVDSGNAQVQLADGPGANAVNVQSRPGDALVVSFAQFLTKSLNITSGGQSIQTGAGTVGDAALSVDAGGADKGTVRGTVGNVTVEQLQHRR